MINLDLQKQLKTKQDCLKLIYDIAVDYDGYKSVESLKLLIDELKDIARYGLNIKQ